MKIVNYAPLLNDDWLCPEIVDREKQRKELYECIIKPYLDGNHPPGCMYITGMSGSGKTFVVRRMIENYLNDIKKRVPKFEYVYISSKKLQTPSINSLFHSIDSCLLHYFPVTVYGRKITYLKHWRDGTCLEILKEILGREICLLLVVDEIDRVVKYENKKGNSGYDLMYLLSDLRNEYNIFTIFISNNRELSENMPLEVKSRIPLFINFSLYSLSDLYSILKTTAKYAVDEVDDDALLKVAKEIAETTCSARDAKRLLYYYLTTNSIEEAWAKMDINGVKDDLLNLNHQQKLVIKAIIVAERYLEKLKKRNIPKRYKKDFVSSRDAYKAYCELCKIGGIEPRAMRTFRAILNGLKDIGLIQYNRIYVGKGRGSIGAIGVENKDILEGLIKDL